MLIDLHIRNYRSIRLADLDFNADRDDRSISKSLKDGSVEKTLLLSGNCRLIVPVKNIIGLPSFGKTSVIRALQAVTAIAAGEDPRRYYHPCAEDGKYRDADCELGIDFTFSNEDTLYDASYTVRFNKLGIVQEELSIEDKQKTYFKVSQGAVTGASKNIIKSEAYRAPMISSCLDENEQQIKCFLSKATTNDMCSSVYNCLKNEFVFLFLQDLSTHSVITAYENLCKDVTHCLKINASEAEEFTLEQLSIFLKDLTGISSIKHKLDLQTGINSLTLEHKINKSRGLLKSATASNNEYSYELDLDDESHGLHALILILIAVIKSLISGAVTVIDDFNSHLPPFSQIYIPRLYKTGRNILSAQLIIVHNGERVMIANGEDCADEVCCIARTPDKGSVLSSGRTLLKNHHVEFSHHNAQSQIDAETAKEQESAPSGIEEALRMQKSKVHMPSGDPASDKEKSSEDWPHDPDKWKKDIDEYLKRDPEAAAEVQEVIKEAEANIEALRRKAMMEQALDELDKDEMDQEKTRAMIKNIRGARHKPDGDKKKKSSKRKEFFFEATLES